MLHLYRKSELHELCHIYADKMRPESKATITKASDRNRFVYYPTKSFTVCTIPGIASEAMKTLLTKGDPNLDESKRELRQSFPKMIESLKKVILVRHPMERLVSVYR